MQGGILGKFDETSKERSKMVPDSRVSLLKHSSPQAMSVEGWRSIVAGSGRRSEKTTEQEREEGAGVEGRSGGGGSVIMVLEGKGTEQFSRRNEMDSYRGL